MTLSKTKTLRSNQTEAEKRLWKELRAKRYQGLKFRRQVAIGLYIADFVCHEKKLVIEVDGGQHANQVAADNQRTKFFEKDGYKVLRFWNNEVLENLEGVMKVIYINIK